MALLQLTEEQVRAWTREQKDEWWLHSVYRGDMPQLTLRSGLTGFVLGGVLAATFLGVLLIPVFFVVVRRLFTRRPTEATAPVSEGAAEGMSPQEGH
jgi:hypothetical protein